MRLSEKIDVSRVTADEGMIKVRGEGRQRTGDTLQASLTE